jgi:MFS family permease
MLMATALPTLFIGMFAGVVVDRFDRKRIMIAADLLRALLVASIPLLLLFGVTWLYVIVALCSAAAQFFEPAQSSVLPETAGDEELAAANSLMTISQVSALTIGYAGAGLIATVATIEWAFYLDALTFVASALCLTFLRIAPLAVAGKTDLAAVVRNLGAGLSFVRNTVVLRSLLLIFIPIFFTFGVANTLMLPFTTRALRGTEFEYSLLEGVFAVGFVAGSLLMARLADRLHEGQWIAISIACMGLTDMALGLVQTIPHALMLSGAYGILNAPSYIGRSLIIQRNTSRTMRGRVSSAFFVARDLAYIIGMPAAGLADLVDVRLLVVANAAVLTVCGLVAFRLPGLGQPTAEWRRLLTMLRTAPAAPGLGLGRAALTSDIDLLAYHMPMIAGLGARERQALAGQLRIYEAAAGTAIVRQGEVSDAAYIVLEGRTAASRADGSGERVLEIHNPGDFFGEIAALTGVQRTASVLADQPTRVLQVPAAALRQLMNDPQIHRVFLSKLTERMMRMGLVELPRVGGLDQETLRELRTVEPAETVSARKAPAAL